MANNIHPVAEFREPRLLACSMDPHLPTALSPKETSPPWHLQQFRNQRINVRGWQHFPNENSSSLSSAQTCSNRARSMGTHGLSSVRSSLAAGSAFAGFPRQSMTIRGRRLYFHAKWKYKKPHEFTSTWWQAGLCFSYTRTNRKAKNIQEQWTDTSSHAGIAGIACLGLRT